MTTNFSSYPWSSLPRMSRREAVQLSQIARWLAVTPSRGARLRRLLRLDAAAPVAVQILSPVVRAAATGDDAIDPHARTAMRAGAARFDPLAAVCEVRVDGVVCEVRGEGRGVRALVQQMLGGPDELAAPRPLGVVEESLWCLVVATVLEDLGVAGHVWPSRDLGAAANTGCRVDLDVALGELRLAVHVRVPEGVQVRVPATSRPVPWLDRVRFDLPIVVGRCAIAAADLERLGARTVVTLERPARGQAELHVLDGAIGIAVRPGALAAEVATGYVPRDMSLPEAHVELTVALGTTQLSLRAITELAVGQVVQLGRPLAGPFELRAGGRVLGRGELVDVDGELAVRIVSLGD